MIVLVMLVLVLPPSNNLTPVTWHVLRDAYLEELMTRTVRWILLAVPGLEVMEVGDTEYHLHNTYKASVISLRVMMFQTTFLNEFVKTYSWNLSGLTIGMIFSSVLSSCLDCHSPTPKFVTCSELQLNEA